MEFFGLSIFCYATEWHMKSIFLGGKPSGTLMGASPRAMVKNGANTKKTQKSHCKAQKGYSWCMFRLGVFEHLEFWALGYTIFEEMSSRKSGDGHVNLTVSCHIKRQLSGTCHVLFCCLELESNRTSATITRKAPFIWGLMSKRLVIDLVCWGNFPGDRSCTSPFAFVADCEWFESQMFTWCSKFLGFLKSSFWMSRFHEVLATHFDLFDAWIGLPGHHLKNFKDCNVWANLCCYPGKAKGLPVALEQSYFLYQHWITYYSH